MKRISRSSAASSVVSDAGLRPGLRSNVRVWMYVPDAPGVFGEGKCRLLQAIDTHGSLLAAAKAIGMSYRKAWMDLRKAEACLGVRLLIRRRGGNRGGASLLTEEARVVLAAYAEFRLNVEKGVNASFARFLDRCEGAGPSASVR